MAGGYSVTISAEDKASATMARINANTAKMARGLQQQANKITGPMQAQMARTTQGMDRYTAGLQKVGNGLRGLARHGQSAFQSIGQIVPVLGVITGAASIAGMERMLSRWAEWGLKISNTARQMGFGARQLTAIQGATNLAGGSAEAAASGMQALAQNLYDAVGGRNAETIVMLRTLGIAYQDGFGKARKAADVMPEIADKISSIRDPFARAQVGMTLFGGAWQGMEPLLVLGSKRIAELQVAAQRLNPVTDGMIERGKDLALAQRELGMSVEGLSNRVADQLAPVVIPMLRYLADWLARSSRVQQAIDWLGRSVQRLGNWLGNLDWDSLSKRAGEWGDRLLGILRAIEAWSPPSWMRTVLGLPAADSGPNGPATPFSAAPSAYPDAAPDDAVRRKHPTGLGRWLYDNFDQLRRLDNFLHGGPRGPEGMPRSSAERDQAGSQIGASLMKFGTSREGAAAILGSLEQESGFNPQAGLGTAHQGLPQWDSTRQARVEARFHQSLANMDRMSQARAVAWEMHTYYPQVWRAVQGHDLAAANDAVTRFYEAPGNYGSEVPRRLGLAERRLGTLPADGAAPAALGTPLAAPQAQGAPLMLNAPSVSPERNDGKATVRVEFGGELPRGMTMRTENPHGAEIGGPLVERPQLLGAMP